MASSEPETHVPGEIQDLLNLYSSLSLHNDNKKVKCKLSGHEMPCKAETINSYVTGKKFKKLASHKEFNYEKYKPHLVPNKKKKHENQMFCKLTLRTLNKQPEHVLRHVNGKRFKKALARWEECKKNGKKFVPRGKRQRQVDTASEDGEGSSYREENESGGSDDDFGSDVDSLSDLHPAKELDSDAGEEEGGSESDFDFEEEVIEDVPPPSGKVKKEVIEDVPPPSGKVKKEKTDESEESISKSSKGKKRKGVENMEDSVSEPIKKGKKRKSEEQKVKPKKAKFEKKTINVKPKKVKK